MRKIYLLVSAGFALAASGVALAQNPAPAEPAPGTTALGALDTDRDGSISRTEATLNPSLSAQFPMLDKNSNGALEPAEFARFDAEARMGGVQGPSRSPRPAGGTLRPPTNPGNPPASLQLDPNTPPELNGTPPPIGATPPPSDATPPPAGATPAPAPAPAPKKTKSTTQPPPPKQGSTYSPRSATSTGGPGDED